jgi:hypothetical protein
MSTIEPAAPNGGVAEDRAHQKSFKYALAVNLPLEHPD